MGVVSKGYINTLRFTGYNNSPSHVLLDVLETEFLRLLDYLQIQDSRFLGVLWFGPPQIFWSPMATD